jgi:hypothetical protein
VEAQRPERDSGVERDGGLRLSRIRPEDAYGERFECCIASQNAPYRIVELNGERLEICEGWAAVDPIVSTIHLDFARVAGRAGYAHHRTLPRPS